MLNREFFFSLQPLYGYGSSDPLPFKPIKESELFFPEDKDVNLPDLATDNKVFNSAGKTTVKGKPKLLCTSVMVFFV